MPLGDLAALPKGAVTRCRDAGDEHPRVDLHGPILVVRDHNESDGTIGFAWSGISLIARSDCELYTRSQLGPKRDQPVQDDASSAGLSASILTVDPSRGGRRRTHASHDARRLGDLLSRRRVFLIGLGVFTVASLLCGLAPNEGVLIGTRFL